MSLETALKIAFENAGVIRENKSARTTKAGPKKSKSEGIMKVNPKTGLPAEDAINKTAIQYGDKRAITSANRKNPEVNRRGLNSIGLSSHRMGTLKSDYKKVVTDSIDNGTDTLKEFVTREKRLIGFRDVDFLARDEQVEWISMSEIDYSTQLMMAIPKSHAPKKLVKSGNKVFMDPQVFVNLVKLQEQTNDVKLVVSFDRGSAVAKTGTLSVIVANPKNPDHNRPGQANDADDEWTRRHRAIGVAGTSGRKGL